MELANTVKTLLKRVQYRPELIDGFLAQTGTYPRPRGRPQPFNLCSHLPRNRLHDAAAASNRADSYFDGAAEDRPVQSQVW